MLAFLCDERKKEEGYTGKLCEENVFRLRRKINQGTKLLSLARVSTFHFAREHEALASDTR